MSNIIKLSYSEFEARFKYDPTVNGPDFLGAGGFGNVYKARDAQRNNEEVAIKIGKNPVGSGKIFSVANEFDTVRANMRSTHPNVAEYKDIVTLQQSDGLKECLVMRCYNCGSLSNLLRKNTLTLPEKEKIAKDIINGLEYIHNSGIIHRDLKTGNILMDKDTQGNWVAVITDFGLSKFSSNGEVSKMSNSNLAHTPEFASPEQVLTLPNIGKESDIWSLGVVLYRLFKGEMPFTSSHAPESESFITEIKIKQLYEPIPSLEGIPQSFKGLISACLIRDPKLRIPTASMAKDRLEGRLFWAIPANNVIDLPSTDPSSKGGGGGTNITPSPISPTNNPTVTTPSAKNNSNRGLWFLGGVAATIAGIFYLASKAPDASHQPDPDPIVNPQTVPQNIDNELSTVQTYIDAEMYNEAKAEVSRLKAIAPNNPKLQRYEQFLNSR